jgi:hypothetical protein
MAGKFKITIYQGSTFELPITIGSIINDVDTPTDLTGYTARMKIKLGVFETTSLIDLTTENGRIVIDPDQVANTGKLTLQISATDTAALDFDQAVYDLELVNGSVVQRYLMGVVKLSREVTK